MKEEAECGVCGDTGQLVDFGSTNNSPVVSACPACGPVAKIIPFIQQAKGE